MSGISDRKKIKRRKEEAIKEYFEYMYARETFEKEDSGIFHPIRAIVKLYPKEKFRIQDVIAEAMNIQSIIDLDEVGSRADAITKFVEKSSVVGYFTTRNDEEGIGFGCSFCRPMDYAMYQKYVGLHLSIPSRIVVKNIDDAKTVTDPFDSIFLDMPALDEKQNHKFIIEAVGLDAIAIYYFPITLKEQFDNFMARCDRYYNGKKKN